MKKIILTRHSFAEYDSSTGNDFDRELSERGKLLAEMQMKRLTALAVLPDQFISSNAIRAKQTIEIFKSVVGNNIPLHYEPFLYNDYSTNDFMNFIYDLPEEKKSVLIVAHNPSIANIAYRLTPDFDFGVKPCTIIIIDFNINSWKEVEIGTGKLVNVLVP